MEVREPIYTFEIARRSVGRAAFHLGIDSMSESALDVMADILLNYLNRVGRTLSHLVEASGRTSAHVNILDALQACEMVASPAVERLHIRDKSSEDDLFATAAASTSRAHLSSDWRGLAAFLFGPKWLEEKDEDDEGSTSAPRQANGAGGKVGPSATDDLSQSKSKTLGWDAPYLDEVLPFPNASEKCANPHPLPPYVGLSLHRQVDADDDNGEEDADEEALDQIPDNVFTSSWGSIVKRKADSLADGKAAATEDVEMTEATDTPPKKKVKIDDGSAKKADEERENRPEEGEREEYKAKIYVPPFYPAPPVMKSATSQVGRKVVDIPPAPRIEGKEEGSKSVRASLVQLGSYWGSGWDDPNSKRGAVKPLAVPLGRSDTGEQPGTSELVVPLKSASGSRVSRILEGSLDASAMQ